MTHQNYRVRIIDTQTGEERLSNIFPFEIDEENLYWWTDGNYSCDCNRGTEFDRASEVEEEEIGRRDENGKYPCSDPYKPQRYYVPEAICEDGARIAIDPPRDVIPFLFAETP